MKSIKNRNKMLFSIANNSGSRRELNNIGAKSSKKHYDPSSESSSDESDSNYYIKTGQRKKRTNFHVS